MSTRINWDNLREVHFAVERERLLRESDEREAARKAEEAKATAAREKADRIRLGPPAEIKAGTRIWRAVTHVRSWSGAKVHIEEYGVGLGQHIEIVLDVDPKKRPVGILRAGYGRRDVKAPIWYAISGKGRGMVLFCYDDLPAGWTYLEVVSVGVGRKSAVVKPVVGPKDELLGMYL